MISKGFMGSKRAMPPVLPGICLLILLALLGIGCARMAPKGEYVADIAPAPVKREAARPTRDLILRWSRQAYVTRRIDPAAASPVQQGFLAEYGQPDYQRSFRSSKGENVAEWIYLKDGMLVQYIDRETAFVGPLTDMERVLIENGYPNSITRSSRLSGPDRQDWIYQNWSRTRSRIYCFADSYLVESYR